MTLENRLPEPDANNLLPNQLTHWVEANPVLPAIVADGEVVSWQALRSRVEHLAGMLTGIGIVKNSRVAALLGNGLPMAELLHAVIQLEATLAPLNLRLSVGELGWQLADLAPTLLIYDAERAELAKAAVEQAGGIALISWQELNALPTSYFILPEKLEAESVLSIIYSSGTTGKPKGVCHTYANHYYNAKYSYINLPAGSQDCWLASLPLFHVGGLAILLRGLFYSMPVQIMSGFEPVAVNQAIDSGKVTIYSVVANMLSRMLDARHDRPYPPTLRAILVGGGPVPLPLLERCIAARIPVIQTYGMTETASQVATLDQHNALRNLGSAGKPLPGIELKIDGDNDTQPGEILLRGKTITRHYLNRPEATAIAWRGGWFHTGDIGYLDKEGFLYIADRRDDLIISGGENIYPAEVEGVLLSHPAVEEAGVVAAPDERWGQVPVAFVKLRDGITANEVELQKFCAGKLARYKLPARIIIVADNLPRNAAGKLLRRELRLKLAST